MNRAVFLVSCVFPFLCTGISRSAEETFVGHFYLAVDNFATLILDGKEFHKSKLGSSKSGEITIKENDVINIRMTNTGGPKTFVLFFLTTDRKKLISFTEKDYRLVPDYKEDGVTAEEFDRLEEIPNKLKFPAWVKDLPVKHKSVAVWGKRNRCKMAVKIRPLMAESYWD